MAKKETAQVEIIPSGDGKAAMYSKSEILRSSRYSGAERDILSVMLKDGANYSVEQVTGLIEKYGKTKI